MRIRTTLLTGALLLASTFAMAQQTPQTTPPQGQTTDIVAQPSAGNFDFGFRAGSFEGDKARFSRYSDFRDQQAGINFKWGQEGATWFAGLKANNVGYRDQSFGALFGSGKLKGSVEWNQTPLYYGASDILKTPYGTASVDSNGVATMMLDSATRTAIQNGTKNGTQSNSALGIVVSPAQADGGTLWRNLATGLDVRSRRDDLKVGLTYQASRDVDVNFTVNSYRRSGAQPWGASFAFNDAVELPLPLDNRTTNFVADVEWANQKGMLKVGYDGSYFDNKITTLVWSNPVRATDGWNGSSYSNAALGGSALGRMALAPNNHANTISAVGLYKLPARSSFNASLAVSSLKQNDALIPFTINSTLQPGTTVTVSNNTWTLVPIERATAEGDVRLTVGTFNFQTRPNRYAGFTAKYRYSKWDNRMPFFENQFNVRFDGAPENVPGSENEPLDIARNQFDADASFTPIPYVAFRVGYGYNKSDWTSNVAGASEVHYFRMFDAASENTFRVSMDTIGNQYVTLRAKYEMSNREGNTLMDGEGGRHNYFEEVGQQPAMRQFDVANRDRKRATVILDVTPLPIVGLSMSLFRGTDDYPDQEFGLLNNNNTGVSFGIDLVPTDRVSFGVNYGYEKYDALQASRNASPGAEFVDPNRNWKLNNTERVDTIGVNFGLNKVIAKTDINIGYDYSKSDQAFAYSGPRIDTLAATMTAYGPNFQPLPNVFNKLQGAFADVKYYISPKIAVGVNYLFQKFDVNDFQTSGLNGYNQYDPIGGLIMGYGWRPYKANVGGVRVIYMF